MSSAEEASGEYRRASQSTERLLASPFRYHPDDVSGAYPTAVGTGSYERVTGGQPAVPEPRGATPEVPLERVAEAYEASGRSDGDPDDRNMFATFDAERVRAVSTSQDTENTKVVPLPKGTPSVLVLDDEDAAGTDK